MKINSNYLVRRSALLLNCSKGFSKLGFQYRNPESKKLLLTNQINQHYYYSNCNHYTSYVVDLKNDLSPLISGDESGFNKIFYANYLDINTISRIRVPIGAKTLLERKIPKELLSKISKNREIAIEFCLFFLSIIAIKNLNHSWVRISSERFRKIRYNYKSIIEVLKYTNGHFEPLIVVKKNGLNRETYETGKESKKFRLSEFYFNKNKTEYKLKNEKIINQYFKILKEALANNIENAIIKNIINLYPRISFPTYHQMIDEAKRLIKLNYVSKKGKKLIFRRDFKEGFNKNNYLIVEDCIARSLALMNNPEILEPSNSKAGGRVTYKLNLINSWIRFLIKIDNEETVELDFKALHPNLAIKLFGGNQKYITHQKIAEKLNIDLNKVKKQHLSYFNEQILAMKNRILHQYYLKSEPNLVENIINDKKVNGYKITSKRMFALEVEIMTEIIKILNSKGIYLIYIYDALACKKCDLEVVKKTMEEVVSKFGIYTTVSENYKYGYMENELNAGKIYKVTNRLNGEVYVGSTTKTIEERKSDHIQRINKDYSTKFHLALAEYGKDNFEWNQIDTAENLNELAEKEKKYILEFKSNEVGYNSDTGGGFKKEVYQFDLKGDIINTFQSLEEAALAVGRSKNSISNACLGGRKTCGGFYWSYSTSIVINNDDRLKKVLQFTLDGTLIREFDSISEANKYTGVNKSSIAKCTKGIRKKAGGFIWK